MIHKLVVFIFMISSTKDTVFTNFINIYFDAELHRSSTYLRVTNTYMNCESVSV